MNLDDYVARWGLTPDGTPFRSTSSDLLFVRDEGRAAVLKLPFNDEERFGGILMRWWNGEGAARLYRLDEATGAMVLERAEGTRDLAAMARMGQDDEAARVLAETTLGLHRARAAPIPGGLIDLRPWFEALPKAAAARGGFFAHAWEVARQLLASEREKVVLHGDVHHGNVLDFGARGWLFVDPKHLFGERTFDYVNILRNPDPLDRGPELLPDPDAFRCHVDILVDVGSLDRERLLHWTFAFAGLSASWIAEDGDDPHVDRAIGALAAGELGLPTD